MGEVRERRSTWSRTMTMLDDAGGENNNNNNRGVGVMRYHRALPWCGCGVGWCCFGMGFVVPVFWYYACFLFLAHCQNDPRERAGLAACAMASLVNTVALAMALVALVMQHHGFLQSSPQSSPPSPPPAPPF